jgi:predicted PurR-regulated permease PerM
LVVVIAGLKAASAIMVPMLVAMFLALLATPAMFWLRDRHLPTGVALGLIVILLIGIVAIVGSLIGSSINELSGALPVYEQKLRLSLELTVAYLSERGIDLPTAGVAEWVDPKAAAQFFGRLLAGFGGILSDSLLIIFMVLFLLLEATIIPAKLRSILPDPEKTMMNFSGFMDALKSYLVIKTGMSLLTGVLVSVWLTILNVEFALLWGSIAFFLNFVPYIGSLIAAIPVVVLTLLDVDLGSASLIAAGYLVINVTVGNLLEPRFMGQGLNLSTLVVFLSLVFWGWVFGPVGMFLSVPLTMLVKIALEYSPRSHWLAVLLSANVPQSKDDSAQSNR